MPGRLLKVLHVATRYLRGGSEVRIRDIVRATPEAIHHLIVGADSDVDLARRELAPARVTVVDALVRHPSPVKDAAALRRIVALVRGTPFDVAVTHQSKAGALGRMASRLVGGPPMIHSLSMASFGPGYPKWQDLLFRTIEARLERGTAAYAVVGEDLARRYLAIGVPAEKLRVIRSSVRLPAADVSPEHLRAEIHRRLGVSLLRPLVLYLGSLEPRKNVLDLPRYLLRLGRLTDGPRPHLVVAGEGPLAGTLADELRREGLTGDASMLGFAEDPGHLVGAADLIILLSRAEGLPQVLVQAAVAGTPFVAYTVDGVRELLRLGATGAAVPLGELGAAAGASARLLRGGGQPTRASIDLSSWSPEAIVGGYRAVIGWVLGRAPTPVGGRVP
jgi:glycosyltransferase involved in cell wall biosynthesis